MADWGNFFLGSPGRYERIPRFDTGQQGALGAILQQGLSGLQQTPTSFEPIRELEMKRFREETIPAIKEGFAGQGGSSALDYMMQQGGVDLNARLAALGAQYGLQQQRNLLDMLGLGLTPKEEIGYFGREPGLLGSFAGQAGAGIAKAIPTMAEAWMKGRSGDRGGGYGGGGGEDTGTAGKLADIATSAATGGATGGPAGAAVGGGTAALKHLLPILLSYMMKKKKPGSGSVTYQRPL